MAKLIFSDGEAEVPDGEAVKDKCMEKGVSFGCEDGLCGACLIEIESGEENLTEKSQVENDMLGEDPKVRLACQCKIKSGDVKIGNY